jgi:hypothetical protein
MGRQTYRYRSEVSGKRDCQLAKRFKKKLNKININNYNYLYLDR